MKRQKTFARNIKNTFLVNAIIPLFLLLAMFSSFFIWYGNTAIKGRTVEAGKSIGKVIAEFQRNYKQECKRMAKNEKVITFLKDGSNHNKIFEEYYSNMLEQDIQFNFVLFDMEENIVLISNEKDGFQTGFQKGRSIFKLIDMGKTGKQEIETIYVTAKRDYGTIYFYGVGTVVYDAGKPIGYLVYYTSDQLLKEMMAVQGVEAVVLTNSFDTILAATTEQARNSLNKLAFAPDKNNQVVIGEELYYMAKFSLEEDEIHIITLNRMEMQRYITVLLFSVIICVMILVVIVLFVLAQRMSKKVTEPLGKLTEGMHQVRQGDLKARIHLKTGDEFEDLADEYNTMLNEINDLLSKNKELFELQKEAEYHVIRNQFSPHFIFNILETLRYTLYMDKEQAEQIILNLSKFLRYNLYANEEEVSLEEDIEHLHSYLELHKARFQDHIDYSIEVPQEAKNIFVPKFFTQPFVENSIKHGFKTRDHLKILVKIRKRQEELEVLIEDNGGGMSPERFEEVQNKLMETEEIRGHLGLYNSHRMLQLIYGEEYGIQLSNIPYEGFQVLIKIPCG